MLADTISLNDGSTARTYNITSREGMDSIRVETTAGVTSAENSTLMIKHTLDRKAPNKPNRHLVALSKSYTDAAGKVHTVTVHMVITRAKGAPDSLVLSLAEMLSVFATDPANINQLMIGGN